MSQTKPKTEDERRAYLRTVLAMNPAQDAEELLGVRNSYHGIKRKAASKKADEKDLHELREEIANEIDELRETFWTMDLKELKIRLSKLELKHFPDLRNAAERLGTMAIARHEFPQLATDEDFDSNFFSRLKKILIISPRDAGDLKDEVLLRVRKSPKITKRVKKMIRLLEDELPDVYDLEVDWFEMLLASEKLRSRGSFNSQSESSVDSAGITWGAIIVILIVLRVVFRIFSSG